MTAAMTAYWYICVPLLILAGVAIGVLLWSARVQPSDKPRYDVGAGEIEDLEFEVHLGRPKDEVNALPLTELAQRVAQHNKDLYAGVFSGGEHADESLAAQVNETALEQKFADDMRALAAKAARDNRRALRLAWLPWGVLAWRRELRAYVADHVSNQAANAHVRITMMEQRLQRVENGLDLEVQRRKGTKVADSLEYRRPGNGVR